jgi:lipoate-protein ligase A
MHGSLLRSRSLAAPEFAGLKELAGRELQHARLTGLLVEAVQAALAIELEPATMPTQLQRSAEQLALEKYLTAAWNQGTR